MLKIKFGTDGWRAIIADQFTLENLIRVSEGTASWLKDNFENPSVIIGYDCRFNGPLFSRTVAEVMAGNGIRVFIPHGFVSTPMVSLAVHKRQVDAGVVITASHNPPEYSGFKIKGNYGGPAYPAIISDVEGRIPEEPGKYTQSLETLIDLELVEYYDMEAVYLNHLKQNFDLRLIQASGMKIGYDAMFGAGQAAFRKIFPHAELLHCEFNPSFLGTPPEPIEKNLKEFQALIREKGLDIGLATDGDADRIGMFDEEGNFVDSHHILLLLIHYMHVVKGMTGKVVITFSVSPKVKKLCDLYDLPYQVTKVGFKYICEIMLKDNVMVGGEESGGIAVAGHVPERDGIYIGLIIVEMMARSGKKLTELIQEIYDLVGSFWFQRRDLHLPEEDKQAIIARCKGREFKAFGELEILEQEEIDGFKYYFTEERWVMIRPSGTEPVLRIYAEGADKATTEAVLDTVISTLKK